MSENTSIVFVAGASRSGTTMLAQVLGLHDQLHTLEETHFFGEITRLSPAEPGLSHGRARQILAGLVAKQARGFFQSSVGEGDFRVADEILNRHEISSPADLFEAFAMTMAARNGKLIPVEQTPRNIFFARLLLQVYPNSRFIEMVRDPRAVLYSQRKRWQIRFFGGANVPLIQSLRVFVNYHAVTMSGLWVSAIKSGLKMKGHPRFMSVRYEDIVENPEAALRELCSFLGVDFQDNMLQAPHTTTSTRTVNRESRGFYKSSISAWNDKLPPGDRKLCELLTRSYALRNGYDLSSDRKYLFRMLLHMLRYPLHVTAMILLNPKRLVVQIRSVYRSLF